MPIAQLDIHSTAPDNSLKNHANFTITMVIRAFWDRLCGEVDFYYWPSHGTPPATLMKPREQALRCPLHKLAF